MELAFDQLFGKVSSGTDAVVRTEAAYTAAEGVGTNHGPIAGLRPRPVRHVDGVRAAEGEVSGYALLTDNDGKADPHQRRGADHRLQHAGRRGAARRRRDAVRPRARRGPREVAIDAPAPTSTTSLSARPSRCSSRARPGVHRGRHRRLRRRQKTSAAPRRRTSTPRPRRRCSAPPASTTHRRQRRPGVSQTELAKRLAACSRRVPRRSPARRWRRRTPTRSTQTSSSSSILFMIFAGIALFVGSFIIWNTFTMIVTQRSREIALLRAVGATRRQVLAQPARRGAPARGRPPRPSASRSASRWPRASTS